jgi:predicted protein tyrosine phosphatase
LQFHAFSQAQVERGPLPGPTALVCMADSTALLAQVKDVANVRARLDLVFNDASETYGLVRSPSDDDAARILQFVRDNAATTPHIVFQCRVGVGRSLAAYAAMLKVYGGDPSKALRQGTHNRTLYRKLLLAAGHAVAAEPLVSMVVRIKYGPERTAAFLLSMQRQRYENWETLFVTDGPNPAACALVERANDPRVRVVETEAPLGRWGHPYRQRGIDASRGALIGLSNDDNYYVPGYLEQMVNAMEGARADLALCAMLHSYWGWQQVEPGHDLGSWIARRELVLRTPWRGDDFFYDAEYLATLRRNAGERTVLVNRPLFVHN